MFIAVTVYGFQQTAITPALPVVQDDFAASREWTTWLLSGYFVVASVTPVFLGKLADRSGKRKVFLAALTAFLAGSIGAALAPSIGLVVVCRLVQGLGGAVFPLSFAIVRDVVPRSRVGSAIGVLTGGFGVGSLLGYSIGGLITQVMGWRWIFWIGAITLMLAIVLVALAVPHSPTRIDRRLDALGAALFGAALSGIVIAVTEGPQRGWTSPLTLGMFATTVVAVPAWVYRELHTSEPLMDLRVLSSRPMLLTNIASLMSGYSAIGSGVVLTYLLQGESGTDLVLFGLAAGPFLTGLALLPRALGQAVGGPVVGPMVTRLGPVPTFASGMGLTTLGLAAMAVWRGSLWIIMGELAVLGLGFGLAVSMMGRLVTMTADIGETGVATSINAVVRRVGGGIGAQVGVALLATITVGAGEEPAREAFTVAFSAAAAAGFIGMICVLLIPRR